MTCGLLGFALTLFVQLQTLSPEGSAHVDTIDMVAAGRDCALGNGCDLKLVPGFPHGGGFIHLLAIVFRLGGEVAHARTAAAVLISSSIGLLCFTVSSKMGAGISLLMLLLFAAGPTRHLFGSVTLDRVFWNPDLVAPCAMLLTAAACCHLSRPRLSLVVTASFAAALAGSFHLVALVLLPAAFALILYLPKANRPLGALLAGATALATIQLGFPTVVLDHDLGLLRTMPGLAGDPSVETLSPLLRSVPLLGILLSAAVVLILSKPSPHRRLIGYLSASHLPLAALLMLSAPDEIRYRYALAPGLTLLIAATLWQLLSLAKAGLLGERVLPRRASWPAMASLALVVLLQWTAMLDGGRKKTDNGHELGELVTFSDIREIARHLGAREHSLQDLAPRLRGNDQIDKLYLFQGMVLEQERFSTGSPSSDPGNDIELIVAETSTLSAPLPEGWRIVRERRGVSLIVRTFEPLLEWDEIKLCLLERDGDLASCTCRSLRYELEHTVHPHDRERLSGKLRMLVAGTGERPEPGAHYVARVPLRLSSELAPQELILPRATGAYPCEGAIIETTGFFSSGELPATRLELPPSADERGGEVVLAWDMSSPSCQGANTPLPPPTALTREIGSLAVETREPPAAFEDPSLLEELLECSKSEPETKTKSPYPHHEPPEPLAPLWHVLLVWLLFGSSLIGGWLACILHRRGSHDHKPAPSR